MAPTIAVILFFATVFATSECKQYYYTSARVEVINIFIFIDTNFITLTCHEFKSNQNNLKC